MCDDPATPYMVGFTPDGTKALVFKADCDLWECKQCAVRKKNGWLVRGLRGCDVIRSNGITPRFVTITSHKQLKSFAATVAIFPRAWNKLQGRMRRKTPSLMYLSIIEGHKDGRLHAHFLTNATLTTRWYKDNCAECGFGFMAESEELYTNEAAAAYIVKYIQKSLGGASFPKKVRRVRTSENWYKFTPDEQHSVEATWLTCKTTTALWSVVEQCQTEGRTMVDLRDGTYFDYGEAAATWY